MRRYTVHVPGLKSPAFVSDHARKGEAIAAALPLFGAPVFDRNLKRVVFTSPMPPTPEEGGLTMTTAYTKSAALKVDCPKCHAMLGTPCVRTKSNAHYRAEMTMVHKERAAKYRAWRDAERAPAEVVPGTLPGPGFKSWAPEVIADSSGKWCGNALRFATKEEAEANVLDLSWRWILVRETRVVESTGEVNYQWSTERGLVSSRKGV